MGHRNSLCLSVCLSVGLSVLNIFWKSLKRGLVIILFEDYGFREAVTYFYLSRTCLLVFSMIKKFFLKFWSPYFCGVYITSSNSIGVSHPNDHLSFLKLSPISPLLVGSFFEYLTLLDPAYLFLVRSERGETDSVTLESQP